MSQYDYSEIAVWEALNEYGCDLEVLREYDLECESIRLVRGVLRIKTPSGYRMLKRMVASSAHAQFLFHALEHVSAGYPNVPRFIRNKFGDPFVMHESGLYYVSEWLPGREADFRKNKQLLLAAEALAEFHSASEGMNLQGLLFPRLDDYVAQGTLAGHKLQSYLDAIGRQVETNPFEDAVEYAAPYLMRMIQHASRLGETDYYLRILQGARDARLLCHGSPVRQNVLIEADDVYFVDFSQCHPGVPMEDLGFLLSRYMPKFDWDFDTGKSILDAYSQTRQLSRLDIHALALYLSFPSRPIAIIDSYFSDQRNWDQDQYYREFQKSLIDEEGREEFVQFLVDTYSLDFKAPDFAYEIQFDDEEPYEELESSSFQAGFIRPSMWQSDFQQAMAAADQAVQEAEEAERLQVQADAAAEPYASTGSGVSHTSGSSYGSSSGTEVSTEEGKSLSKASAAAAEKETSVRYQDPTSSSIKFHDAMWSGPDSNEIKPDAADSMKQDSEGSAESIPANTPGKTNPIKKKTQRRQKAERQPAPQANRQKQQGSRPGIWLGKGFSPSQSDES